MRVMAGSAGCASWSFWSSGSASALSSAASTAASCAVRVGSSGAFPERGAEQGLGLGILLAQNEQVRQAGVGGDGFGFFREDAAIGGFGGVVLAGLFSQLGGKESVFGSFGREFQGLKQIV